MFDPVWNKVAQEYGLIVDEEEFIAYGNYRGFAMTLDFGFDRTRTVGFTGHFPSKAAELAVKRAIELWDWHIDHIYRIVVNKVTVRIEFEDSKDVTLYVERVLDRLIPILEESGFAGEGHCACCGLLVESDGIWNTDVDEAYYLHRGCYDAFQDIRYEIEEQMLEQMEEEEREMKAKKSEKGLRGAFNRLFKS